MCPFVMSYYKSFRKYPTLRKMFSCFLLFYLLLNFVTRTNLTIVPLIDVQDIVLESQSFKCESGCHLVDIDMKKLECHKVEDGHMLGNNLVTVGTYQYYCFADVRLPEKIIFEMNTFDCIFSDEENKLLLVGSCFATYSLLPKNEGSVYDFFILCILISLLILLFLFGSQEYFKNMEKDEWQLDCLTNNDPISDTKEAKVIQDDMDDKHGSRRQEFMFNQGHSFINDRRRVRSRSRKR